MISYTPHLEPAPHRARWKDRIQEVRHYSWKHKLALLLVISLGFAMMDMLFFNNVSRLEFKPPARTEVGIDQ